MRIYKILRYFINRIAIILTFYKNGYICNPIAPWCNGSTPVFGTVSSGSSPGGVTFKTLKILIFNILRVFKFEQLSVISQFEAELIL